MSFTKKSEADTFYCTLHIAGSYYDALRFCKEYSYKKGRCFQVQKCKYVYTGGTEDGMIVRVIDYPRFPKGGDVLLHEFTEFSTELAEVLCQKSFTIESTLGTQYFESSDPLHTK